MRALFIVLCLVILTGIATAQGETLPEGCRYDSEGLASLLDDVESAYTSDDTEQVTEAILALRRKLDLDLVFCLSQSLGLTDGATRANPVPLGDAGSVSIFEDKFMWRVVSFNPDATDEVVQREDDLDAIPPEGMRYVLVEVEMVCDKSAIEICEANTSHVALVGSVGITYERPDEVGAYYERREIFGGAVITYQVPFMVGVDETDFVVFNLYSADGSDERRFFATK